MDSVHQFHKLCYRSKQFLTNYISESDPNFQNKVETNILLNNSQNNIGPEENIVQLVPHWWENDFNSISNNFIIKNSKCDTTEMKSETMENPGMQIKFYFHRCVRKCTLL